MPPESHQPPFPCLLLTTVTIIVIIIVILTILFATCLSLFTSPTMTRYPPVNQHWDRWHQPVPHPAAPDYSSMMQVDSMVSYDPRPVPPAAALQRPTMATPYSVATSYAESPVTPMASSPYPSQGHFADYPPCSYQSPAVPSSAFAQMPYRSSYRPLAPPTPPLDEDRALRPDAGRLSYATGDAHDKSTRRSAAVKPEANEEHRAIKTIPKFVKLNGELQYESTRKFDLVLRLADKKINTEPEGDADTPQSMASPVPSPPEEEVTSSPVVSSNIMSCADNNGMNSTSPSQSRSTFALLSYATAPLDKRPNSPRTCDPTRAKSPM